MTISAARHAIQHFFGETELAADPNFTFPYASWEKLFVARWGLQPLPSGTLIRDYMFDRGIEPLAVNIVQALQTFHLNRFNVPAHMYSQFHKMESDYDRVPPFVVGLGELEADDQSGMDPSGDRREKQMQQHMPNRVTRNRRKYIG